MATDLPDKVVAALELLARGQRSHRRAVASEHGLSPLQAELLSTIGGGTPPQPVVGALAFELGVSQPTVTDSVRALEAKGLVDRLPDPDDGRRTTVALTRQGARVAVEVAAGGDDLSDAVRSLDRAAQETTLGALLALVAHLVGTGTITVARTCPTCRYRERVGDGSSRCSLLDQPLAPADLRVDCPEHQPARPA